MQDLTFVGLTEDRQRVVLVSDSGEEFSLPVNAALRAALRGEAHRPGQLEIPMESALRPRDIQARIRAGETPEAVAAAAQTTIEKIMGYATPVLAERAHVADRAQRASVRRKAGEGPARILGDAVAERLRARSLDPSAVEWDAWRRDDGRWTLVADYRSGESARHAEFIFDAPGRYVVAEDDEARWLVGEPSHSKGPQPRQTGHSTGGRRLVAVDTEDEALPLGEDAIEMVTDPPADEPTEDLSETAASVRAHAPADTDNDLGLTARGDADWMATQASERPAREKSVAPVETPDETPDDTSDETLDEPAAGEGEPEEPQGRPRKGRSRPTVPSWDEIMFGGGGKRD